MKKTIFIIAASNRVTVCPFASAALINASVIAKLFPFFRGLPVITTIFLLIAEFLLFSAGLTFPNADIIIIARIG